METVRPGLVHGNRHWNRLRSGFRQRLLAVFRAMKNQYGYSMVLIEGYRSPARQRRLNRRDAYTTHAGPGQSYHQYGLAADCALYRNGKLRIKRDSAWMRRGYRLYGKLAKQRGLIWGGNWSLHDYGHVELRGSGYEGPAG